MLIVLEKVILLLLKLFFLPLILSYLSLDFGLVLFDLILKAPAIVSTLLSHVMHIIVELKVRILFHHNVVPLFLFLLFHLSELLILVLTLLRNANLNDFR